MTTIVARKPASADQYPVRWEGRRAGRALGGLVAVLLCASALRAAGLDQQALRGDEGFGPRFVQLTWGDMLASMALSEPHPPLYYFFQKLWIPLAGDSEFALRWPSVLGGVLTTALTWPLARRWAGRRAAGVAMLLTALSPFLVWFSQDARMYTPLTALALAALWHTWRGARHGRTRDWIVAGLLWEIALFTHYFAAFALALAGLALILAPRTRARWRPALGMATLVGLGYLPWALYVGDALGAQVKGWEAQNAAWRLLTAFSVGPAEQGGVGPAQWLGAGLLAVLLVLGTIEALRRDRTLAAWLIALAVGVPALVVGVGALRAVFAERFALTALPVALMLAALGLEAARRRAGAGLSGALLAGLALAALLSLQNYFFDPAFVKSPDWRGLARYLTETGRPDEIILVNLPDPSFEYYYRGPLPFEDAPPGPLAAVGATAAEAQLERVLGQYAHIRFLYTPSPGYDPDGFVGRWLDACCEKTDDRFVSRFRVQAYDTPAGSMAARRPYRAEFTGGPVLTGYRFVPAAVLPGQPIQLTLFWTTTAPVAADYTVFVHVLAADGFQLAGADGQPRAGAAPTSRWAVEQVIIDPRPISLDLPPGEYAVELGLYRLETGERLQVRLPDGTLADHVRVPEPLVVAASP